MLISPEPMRYTPQTTMPTVTHCVTKVAKVTARVLYLRASLEDCAEMPETDSHSFCIRLSAMLDFTVSSPLTISTSRAFFCMLWR